VRNGGAGARDLGLLDDERIRDDFIGALRGAGGGDDDGVGDGVGNGIGGCGRCGKQRSEGECNREDERQRERRRRRLA
jgi:hypothetical protein